LTPGDELETNEQTDAQQQQQQQQQQQHGKKQHCQDNSVRLNKEVSSFILLPSLSLFFFLFSFSFSPSDLFFSIFLSSIFFYSGSMEDVKHQPASGSMERRNQLLLNTRDEST